MNCSFEEGEIYHLIAHWRILGRQNESGAGKNGIRVLVSMNKNKNNRFWEVKIFKLEKKICYVMSYSTPPRIYDTSLLLLSGPTQPHFALSLFISLFYFYFFKHMRPTLFWDRWTRNKFNKSCRVQFPDALVKITILEFLDHHSILILEYIGRALSNEMKSNELVNNKILLF